MNLWHARLFYHGKAAIRRRRLTASEARTAWAAYERIPLRLVEVDIDQAVALGAELGVYAYDAYMLMLARSRNLPLLTLDTRLGAAARLAGVELVEI